MATLSHEEVCWLDVPVDDPFGVGRVEPVRYLDGQVKNGFDFHRPTADAVFQRRTVQILHCNEGLIVLLSNFVDGADVRMIQSRRGLCFPPEPFKRLKVPRNFIRKEFQGHEPTKGRVLGLVDHPHATAAEFFHDSVM